MICYANHLTGFYVMVTLAFTELTPKLRLQDPLIITISNSITVLVLTFGYRISALEKDRQKQEHIE